METEDLIFYLKINTPWQNDRQYIHCGLTTKSCEPVSLINKKQPHETAFIINY